MLWLVNIVDREATVRRAAAPAVQARKEELLALWREHVGPVAEGGEGDYEDFWEQAYRLEAAVLGLGPENIWLTVSSRVKLPCRNNVQRKVRRAAELCFYSFGLAPPLCTLSIRPES